MNKQELLNEIRKYIENELALILEAAKAAHEAATHEESKAEDHHDTRAIESSYLAGAQAQRAAELQQALLYFRLLELRSFGPQDLIAPSAVVELESPGSDGKRSFYLIAQHGGGIRVSVGGRAVLIITPHSPMGEELLGKRVGETVEVKREYVIQAVF